VWTGLLYLRTTTSDKHFWRHKYTFRFHRMRPISDQLNNEWVLKKESAALNYVGSQNYGVISAGSGRGISAGCIGSGEVSHMNVLQKHLVNYNKREGCTSGPWWSSVSIIQCIQEPKKPTNQKRRERPEIRARFIALNPFSE